MRCSDHTHTLNRVPNNNNNHNNPRFKQVSPYVFSVVARMFAPSVGTMMNGEHAFATSGGTSWRRRQRRLRAFRRFVLWHSKMEVAAALHHTCGLRTSSTTQFSSTAVEPIAPVVVSLPPVEEFTGPVYDQVHQEQFAAGEMSENLVGIPFVQEQVIVQAIPEVVDSHPPAEKFTRPVYNHVHQEQFSADEITENLVEFPVVQEQVIVQAEEFTGPGFNQVHHEQHIAAVPATTEFFPLSDDEGGELCAGLRPALLCEPLPQEQVQRHTVEQVIETFVPVQVLDSPVLQLGGEQVVEFFHKFDPLVVAEPVIEVPKISLDKARRRFVAANCVRLRCPNDRKPNELEKDDPMHRNFRHNCLGCLTEPSCDAQKAPF